MRLKDIREDRDITQGEVAAFLHVKQNTYSQYENGKRGIPVETLVALSGYFDTSVDYLLGLTDEIKPYPRRAVE
ncbi:MAG: helix-turn-helix transcriptional regulator [Ruminococcus sp.]|nr:helix-turn-helix domain-containing protein [Ruminococcus sp.]MDD7670711.1 helix-turn-helix transcriptional regulator [Ruminococcus sp.]MDY2742851.1 helix-turn-helix transcriptional regulator [Eubacteriales bacterium]